MGKELGTYSYVHELLRGTIVNRTMAPRNKNSDTMEKKNIPNTSDLRTEEIERNHTKTDKRLQDHRHKKKTEKQKEKRKMCGTISTQELKKSSRNVPSSKIRELLGST